MDKKRYKVKIENGKIIPLEPIDIKDIKEGVVIFFDKDIKDFDYDPSSLMDLVGIIDAEPSYKELTPELIDSIVYEKPEDIH